MTGPLVCCADAGRTFGHGANAVVAVHGVTAEVHDGTRVALMGPSGSGKSTLLHLMAGLDVPTSGSVTWPAWHASPFRDPSRAGVVFQGPSLIPSLTARENAAFPLLATGHSHDEAMQRAGEALRALGIGFLTDKLADELSGGQAQRVAVARVLASRPRLILADEPTGRLDQASGERVVALLLDTAAHLGAGLVVATHDPTVSRRLGWVWSMHDGELAVAA